MDVDEEELTKSQDADKFSFKIVLSDRTLEASCFVKESGIPGAGRGLFIKPHGEIKKGTYICTYATNSTTEADVDASGSSRMYAIQVGHRWFDAEHETANCFGRFANQKNVMKSLETAREMSKKSNFPEIHESDWISINSDAEASANVSSR